MLLTVDFEGGLHCGHIEVDLSDGAKDTISRFGVHSPQVAAEMALYFAKRGDMVFLATTPGHPTGQQYVIVEFDDDPVAPYIWCIHLPIQNPVHVVAELTGGEMNGRAEVEIPLPKTHRLWNDDGTMTREAVAVQAFNIARSKGVGGNLSVKLNKNSNERIRYEIIRFEDNSPVVFIACRLVSGPDDNDY